jgi:hypothetical protein
MRYQVTSLFASDSVKLSPLENCDNDRSESFDDDPDMHDDMDGVSCI